MTDSSKSNYDTKASPNLAKDAMDDSHSDIISDGKFYDGMPEDELERLLLESIEDTTSSSSLTPSLESKLTVESKSRLQPTTNTTISNISDTIEPNRVIDDDVMSTVTHSYSATKIDIEALRQQALDKQHLKLQSINHTKLKQNNLGQDSTTTADGLDIDNKDIDSSNEPTATIVIDAKQLSKRQSIEQGKPDPDANTPKSLRNVVTQVDNNSQPLTDKINTTDTADETTVDITTEVSKEAFEKQAKLVAQTIDKIKDKLQYIADESAIFGELTTQLVEQTRHLQQMGEDDFSVTYEQIYQFRSCLFEARRAFSEIPNFMDMVEHAWDNDIYTAQMRQKFLHKKK